MSKYPAAIDDTTTLPLTTDLITPVKAQVVNNLRSPIIAIEAELGVNPSGTYTTVKARLDAIEAGGGGGGGGGGGSVAVGQNGSTVVSETTKINFTGDVTVSPGAIPHQVDVNIGQSTTAGKQESKTVSNGQTVFNLNSTPIQNNVVEMFVNGLKQQYSGDYTVNNTVVTYTGISLINTDKVDFVYVTQLGNMSSSVSVAIIPPLKYHEYGVAGVQTSSATIFNSVGSFEFDPSSIYGGPDLIRDFWFEAIILSSTISVTTSIQVYNLTDGVYIASTLLSTTSTASTFLTSSTLTVPTNLPNSSKIYEIHIKKTGGTTDDVAIVKMARLVIRYQAT